MAKRKSRRLLVTGVVASADLAKSVVTNYINKAKTELEKWAGNYSDRIKTYATSTETEYVEKRKQAMEKLEAWYDVYKDVVYPEIIGVFSKAKSEYVKRTKPVPATAPA
jgi:ATPase subunit of ABC transporter with duplicated ATPase domains